MSRYLLRRNGFYTVRLTVPKRYREVLRTRTGKPREQVWKALHTDDPAEAERRRRGVLAELLRRIDNQYRQEVE